MNKEYETLQGWFENLWEERFECLKEFYKKNGHINVPRNFIDSTGHGLYYWIKHQNRKHFYKELESERVKRLEQLSYWQWKDVRPNSKPVAYSEHLNELSQYLQDHGELPHYLSRLGRWYQKQKSYYGSGELSSERILLFEQAGITLEVQQFPGWMDSYNKLRSLGYIPKHNSPVGRWCYKQKVANRENKLSLDLKNLLNSLPFWNWDIKKNSTKSWMDSYKALKAFVEANQRFPKRREPLGAWFFKQRRRIYEHKIHKDQYYLLIKIPQWSWYTEADE